MSFAPVVPRSSFRLAGPLCTASNCMDSRAVSPTEQAKNVRSPVLTFTCHSQLFHKHWKCASRSKIFANAKENAQTQKHFWLHCTKVMQFGLRKSWEIF